jgi:hypothetical protein
MTTGKKTRKSKKTGGMLPLAAMAASVPIVIDIVKEIIDRNGKGISGRSRAPSKKGSGTRIPRGNGTRIPRGNGTKKTQKK